MPRNVTVTLDDGTQHSYQNIPDDVTPDQVTQRAQKDFGKNVTAIDGGTGKAMGDMNGAKVVITFKENNAPTTYTGSLATITS